MSEINIDPINDTQRSVFEAFNTNSLDKFKISADLTPLQGDVVDSLNKVLQNPELHKKFNNQFTKELNKSETREFLDREINALTGTILRTKQNFEKVSNTLVKFDDFRTSKGDSAEPLRPKWQIYQKTFNDLMSKSREAAKEGVYYAKRYRQVILDIATDPKLKEDARVELDGFIEDIEKLQTGSDDLSHQFDHLRSEISSFKAVMDTKDKIERIESELTKWGTTATIGWLSLGVGATLGVGIAAAVGLGLAAMTPVGWAIAAVAALFAVGGIAGGVVGKIKQKELNKQLVELRQKLMELNSKKDELDQLQVLFDVAYGEINDICNSIGVIARIWSIFSLDASLLKKALADCKTARTDAGLIRQVKMTQKQYEALEANLETYGTKMAEVEK
ncbi:hypothetical protein VKT23_000145 [Stygiomarasmius scandens]|uniref:Uncharacterized protein n=1 Tax=Marasmiellus scandens TaxID=2682957 RepID=A0ABR1K3N2_9AGAR